MSEPITPPADSTELAHLRARIAEVDAWPMKMPLWGNMQLILPRMARAEAKNALLSDYVVYLLQRIEHLERSK
jgi:hypothetical protein